jgi:hypothetical protein
MAGALRAYREAAGKLLEGEFASRREFAPPHLRVPCHIYVICCPDGVLVRYDAAGEEEPKMRCIDHPDRLEDVAPAFFEQVIHVPDDPETYVPKHDGPGFVLQCRDLRGEMIEELRLYPHIYAPKSLAVDVKLPQPSERPPCLASLHRELLIDMRGEIKTLNTSARAIPAGSEFFVAHGVKGLAVGWQAIEIYPRLSEEYWRPEYAAAWAQLDLMSAVAQHNIVENALYRLDGRRAAREKYARLLEQFEALLEGPEEPCHQFLKANPGLLCTTHDNAWSKLRFGKHISDFVFHEPGDGYLLVEIEAPYRKLFRKNGHSREALVHAIGQVDDWLRYIQDNKAVVESELGLHGISATPHTLVVIGRSASLTERDRKKLDVIRGQRPMLSILTYDEVIAKARANLERHFGPLSMRAQNLDLYFYRADPAGDN